MSIWGAVQSSHQLFRGCRIISTSSHGGIVLTANALAKNPMLEKLRSYPAIESYYANGNYYFEEDCDASMVLFLLSDEILSECFSKRSPEDTRKNCLNSFVQYNPEYFTHVTGKGLSIFDSPVLLNQLVQSNPEHYLLRTCYSESNYNVPNGHVHFIVENGSKNRIGLIAPNSVYKMIRQCSFLPVSIELYERFEMDTDLPMSKPKNRVENAFLVAQSRRESNSTDIQVVKAFSYQTNEYKYFRMTRAYEKSLAQEVDSRVWIKFKDSSHSQLEEDLELFIQEVDKSVYENAVQFMRLNKVA